jgi:hypothetical protein
VVAVVERPCHAQVQRDIEAQRFLASSVTMQLDSGRELFPDLARA